MNLSQSRGRWSLLAVLAVLGVGCNGDRNNSTAASGSGASATEDGGSDTTGDGTTAASMAESSDSGGSCRSPQTGGYNDCVNASASVCDHEDASCLVNVLMEPVWGVCFLRCEEDCDCWGPPGDGTATPRCATVLSEGGSACILDCDDDRTCPSGMRCLGLNGVTRACVFDVDGLGMTGDASTSSDDDDSGEDGASSSSSTSSTESSTGAGSDDAGSSTTDATESSGTSTMG